MSTFLGAPRLPLRSFSARARMFKFNDREDYEARCAYDKYDERMGRSRRRAARERGADWGEAAAPISTRGTLAVLILIMAGIGYCSSPPAKKAPPNSTSTSGVGPSAPREIDAASRLYREVERRPRR